MPGIHRQVRDSHAVTTGRSAPVAGTPMDFTEMKAIAPGETGSGMILGIFGIRREDMTQKLWNCGLDKKEN